MDRAEAADLGNVTHDFDEGDDVAASDPDERLRRNAGAVALVGAGQPDGWLRGISEHVADAGLVPGSWFWSRPPAVARGLRPGAGERESPRIVRNDGFDLLVHLIDKLESTIAKICYVM